MAAAEKHTPTMDANRLAMITGFFHAGAVFVMHFGSIVIA